MLNTAAPTVAAPTAACEQQGGRAGSQCATADEQPFSDSTLTGRRLLCEGRLDRRSLLHNLEAGLVIADRTFGERLEQAICDELVNAREIVLGEWQERPRWRRALEWLAYRFRYWL